MTTTEGTPTDAGRGRVLWRPPADVSERSRIGRYMAWLAAERGRTFAGYDELWEWSVTDLDGFWRSIWDHFSARLAHAGDVGPRRPGHAGRPLVPRRRTLNYAAHALRSRAARHPSLVGLSQTRGRVELSMDELRDQVARCRAGLAALGVGRGDRVAAYLPNIPETVVAFLATASLGAVWSSCAPEFGTRSVLDRLQQIEPTVLLAVDGYRYGAKAIDRSAEVAAIRAALPSVQATVTLPYLAEEAAAARHEGSILWDDLLGRPHPTRPVGPSPSSSRCRSTTRSTSSTRRGPRACPSRSCTATAASSLEHHKVLALHSDLGPGDRFFWFSTTGWMMWNFLVSGLLVGATPSCCSTAIPATPTSTRCGAWRPRRG